MHKSVPYPHIFKHFPVAMYHTGDYVLTKSFVCCDVFNMCRTSPYF